MVSWGIQGRSQERGMSVAPVTQARIVSGPGWRLERLAVGEIVVRGGMAMRKQPYRVLVADDDAQCRDSLVSLLNHDGYRVRPASSGCEALDWLRAANLAPGDDGDASASQERVPVGGESAAPFDFIVLDYNMPDLSGIEVLRMVRVNFQLHLPALFVSGEVSVELHRSVVEAGGYALLPKPIEPILFRTEIRNLVRLFLES